MCDCIYASAKLRTCRKARTDIAIDAELDVGIVSPYHRIDALGKILEEEPKTQESDTEVPAFSDEAGKKYEEQHHSSQNAGDGVQGVRWVDCGHVVVCKALAIFNARIPSL